MSLLDEEDGPWGRLFDAHSSRAEVDAAVERWVRVAVDDFAETLANDPDLSPVERADLLATAVPRIRLETAKTFINAWRRLREAQADETAIASSTIH